MRKHRPKGNMSHWKYSSICGWSTNWTKFSLWRVPFTADTLPAGHSLQSTILPVLGLFYENALELPPAFYNTRTITQSFIHPSFWIKFLLNKSMQKVHCVITVLALQYFTCHITLVYWCTSTLWFLIYSWKHIFSFFPVWFIIISYAARHMDFFSSQNILTL